MKCVVCRNEISEIHMNGHVFHVGVVEDVSPGYGSSHDLRKIRVGICDNCLSNAEKSNTVKILKDELNLDEY